MSFARRLLASLRTPAIAAMALAVAGCAATPGSDNDPLEGLNRGIFAFNRGVDTVVLRPAAVVYQEVVPDPIRDRFRDFLNNLKTPVVLVNDLLQGDLDRAEITFRRFFINTIAGVGGLIDIASYTGIPRHSEDFGQTLAVWGVGEGPYIVLPFLGPSGARDTVGLVVDYFMDPVRYYLNHNDHDEWQWIRTGVDVVDQRQRALKLTDDIERDAVDLYAKMRSLYRQHRSAEIRNGAPAKVEKTGEPAYPGQVMN